MTRIALAKKLQKKSGMSTCIKAKKIIRAIILSLQEIITEDKKIALTGFGSFKIIKRCVRKGRNLKTKAEIYIPAHNTVKFTPSKKLAKAILPKI